MTLFFIAININIITIITNNILVKYLKYSIKILLEMENTKVAYNALHGSVQMV